MVNDVNGGNIITLLGTAGHGGEREVEKIPLLLFHFGKVVKY